MKFVGVAVAISSPVIRGARMSSGLIREAGMQIRKQKLGIATSISP